MKTLPATQRWHTFVDRNSKPFIGLDMAISLSRESSSADNLPPSCSESETFDSLLGSTTFEDGLEVTIPLEAVIRGGKVNFASDCTTEPERECCSGFCDRPE